ncbi:cyclic lactone autoinducer peptide [Tissierella praeacuta]
MKNKRYLLNLVAVLAFTFAEISAMSNCWGFLYQPKMPQQLRK